MTKSAITAEIHQPLDIHRDFPPKITFDRELRDLIPKFVHLGVGHVFDLGRGANPGRSTNLARPGAAYAINRRQRNLGMLMIWDIYSSDTGHTLFLRKIFDYNIHTTFIRLALPLLVPRICANYAHDAIAPNNFAIAANLFY
jgi:hypothetical protein